MTPRQPLRRSLGRWARVTLARALLRLAKGLVAIVERLEPRVSGG